MAFAFNQFFGGDDSLELSGRIKQLHFLIVEDQDASRNTLRSCAVAAGGFYINFANSYPDAIYKIKRGRDIHIVLCDYNLGDGRSGQQLLEEVRRCNLVPENLIWIMVTAEQSYEQVVSAVELAPDDYVLKPFSAAVLQMRIEKSLRKHDFFEAFYHASPANLGKRLGILDGLLQHADAGRYRADILRKKAEEYARHGYSNEAITVYDHIIRDVFEFPWAQAGKARALIRGERYREAESIIAAVVRERPEYFDAHDIHAEVLMALGDDQKAQEILTAASLRTPRNYVRKRLLGRVALINGDMETASRVMSDVMENDVVAGVVVEDVVALARAKISTGDKPGALAVINKVPPGTECPPKEAVALVCLKVCSDAPGSMDEFEQLCRDVHTMDIDAAEIVDVIRAALHCQNMPLAIRLTYELLAQPSRVRTVFRLLSHVYVASGNRDALREIQRRVAQEAIQKAAA